MIKSFLFKTCPKTKRIVGINKKNVWLKIFFPFLGLAALLWFIIRVLPKPSRIAYPCQQVAAPIAFSFISYLLSVTTVWLMIKKVGLVIKQKRYWLALCVVFSGTLVAVSFYVHSVSSSLTQAAEPLSTGRFVPVDKPNEPMGVAQGIFPGRVTWVHDSLSARWDGKTGFYWEPRFNSQGRISEMFQASLCALTGEKNTAAAWKALFIRFNKKKGHGEKTYQPGEKIVLKVNMNNKGGGNIIDALPQSVYAVLDELVHVANIKQEDIYIIDGRRLGMAAVYNYVHPYFPNVVYNDNGGWVDNAITYSQEITDERARQLVKNVYDANYIINMAILKRHCEVSEDYQNPMGQTGITCTAKNYFGLCNNPAALHPTVRDWNRGMGSYNPIVDLMSNERIGQNTMLFLIDGIYGGNRADWGVVKFRMAPFNNQWCGSIFTSLDPVAIESVALDFLHTEMPLVANADNFMHEAAQIGNPPSKTNYLRKDLVSLGVHEHWNNPTDKRYSRNLGKGNGIELFTVNYKDKQPLVNYFYPNKNFVYAGDSVRINWSVSNVKQAKLDNKSVASESFRYVKPIKSTMYNLVASAKKEQAAQTAFVKVLHKLGTYEAESAKIDGKGKIESEGNGWTGTGYVSFSGTDSGSIEWTVAAPEEKEYSLVFTYSGKSPDPFAITVNGVLQKSLIGVYELGNGQYADFEFTTKLTKGENTIRLEPRGRFGKIFDKLTVATF